MEIINLKMKEINVKKVERHIELHTNTFKSWKAFCEVAEISNIGGNTKKAYLKKMDKLFKWHREGNKIIIDSVINEKIQKLVETWKTILLNCEYLFIIEYKFDENEKLQKNITINQKAIELGLYDIFDKKAIEVVKVLLQYSNKDCKTYVNYTHIKEKTGFENGVISRRLRLLKSTKVIDINKIKTSGGRISNNYEIHFAKTIYASTAKEEVAVLSAFDDKFDINSYNEIANEANDIF